MDLLASLVIRLGLALDEIPQDLVLVSLHDVGDAAVSQSEEAARVPHGGVAKGAGNIQFLEVREFLLDDLHPTTDVPGSHIGKTTQLRHGRHYQYVARESLLVRYTNETRKRLLLLYSEGCVEAVVEWC